MNRFLPSVLAISTVLALAATAGAEDRNHQDRHDDRRPDQRRPEQRRHGFGTWGGIPDSFKKHHGPQQHPKHNPIPIDPGRGDGRVPVDPVPSTPPVNPAPRDGFVWVNGHWERARAAPKAVNPYPAGTTVRDHRTTTGSVTVRDHRTTTDSLPAGATVRDHRTSTGNASGGVTVTVINPSAAKDAPMIRDHRTTPVIRDHRTPSR